MEGYINICACGVGTYRVLSTKSDFFKEPVIINLKDGCLEFTKPSLDYRGKLFSFNSSKKDEWYRNSLSSFDMPLGKFYFDEDESNEDIVVVYLDDK